MRSRFARHLQWTKREQPREPATTARALLASFADVAAPAAEDQRAISPEFNGHQYAIFLLHVAAEIEHALMVEYLFAAYTLGGPHVGEKQADAVREWQEVIFGIAKEEMGHLVSVQNVLRLISGPISFDRDDYPFDAEFYPFSFTLEKLTLDSLAKYIVAEAPVDWSGELADEVRKRANHSAGKDVTHVATLYRLMIETIRNDVLVHDDAFHADTIAMQASWEEWGRGYTHGQRGNETHAAPPQTPELIIKVVDSRASAVDLLDRIAQQGEATVEEGETSHFSRFLDIYLQWKALVEEDQHFDPSRPVVTNPTVGDCLPRTEPLVESGADATNTITDPVTFYWAHLFNVRYRMLLTGLMHVSHVAGSLASTSKPSARGQLITLIFGEMYKLRGLAGLLMTMPVHRGGDPTKHCAGPPFQMPYTMDIPEREVDRWRWHRDLLFAARDILDELAVRERGSPRLAYVRSMRDADANTIAIIEAMIAMLDNVGAEVTR